MGQLFHYFEAPNRFGLPAFYTLHVWAWKDNPNGAFVNWHPDVSCQSFDGHRVAVIADQQWQPLELLVGSQRPHAQQPERD